MFYGFGCVDDVFLCLLVIGWVLVVVGVAAGPIACCLLDYAALWVVCVD